MFNPRFIRRQILYLTILLMSAIAFSPFYRAQLPQPPAAMAASAGARPIHQEELPPSLLNTTPADGATWNGGSVIFTFDQSLAAEASVAFLVEPEIAGEVTVNDAQLTFTPTEAPQPGERYRFLLDADATSATGVALGTPVEITVVAATPLAVTSTQPSNEAPDIAVDSQIVVIFNQPVIALVGVDDQENLPQPLTIEPALEGEGQWLNTSIYRFEPAMGLAGGTNYNVTVADITGLNGETLAEPYQFTFTTATPIVLGVQAQSKAMPYFNGPSIPPDSTFQISFSQPMDRASTEDAIQLLSGDDARTPVPVDLTWSEDLHTVTITPTTPLDFGGSYEVVVEESAQPSSQQGNLRNRYAQLYTVVPLPAIVQTNPEHGATDAPPEMTVTIQFNTVLSETTIAPNISVTPTMTNTQIATYYRSWENTLDVNWFRESGTTYTVTVGADIADPYGNTLGEPYSFSFTTGDQSDFVRLGIDRFTHFSAYTETRVSTLYRNISSLDARLYQLPIEEMVRLAGENQWEVWQNYSVPNPEQNLLWERNYAPRVGRNITAQQIISMTTATGDLLAPGVYLLEVTYPERQVEENADPFNNPNQALIVISNNNLLFKKSIDGNSLAWITNLQTGQPVGDLPVRFYQNTLRGEATTDGDGIAVADLNLSPDMSWIPALAISGEPGDPNFTAASSEWNQGIGPWDFNLNGGYGAERIQSYFYTDRPIYRPGQTIYWKGIVRQLVAEEYELPPDSLPIAITIRDDRGETVFESDYTPDENGTLNGELTLAPEAVTGYYYIEALLQIEAERTVYGGVGFQVAAYRKPEFEINVTSDQPEYTNGDEVTMTVQASYFSGGPMGNAPVTWRLLTEPYFYSWRDEDGRYYSFTPYDPENENYDPYRSAFYGGMVQEGVGKTNADGNFTLTLPADLRDVLQSQQWTIDVTVQSPTNQFVSGRTSFPVHKGEFYIGLSPQSYVAQVGQENAVDIVTITPQGEPYPGSEVTAVIYEFEWNSVYAQGADGAYAWQTSVERTPIYTTTVTTDRAGRATLTWQPETGGQYQIVADGEDDQGNAISSATFVWASGSGYVAWPRENNDRIELVADKELYAPGETAELLVPSPFTGTVEALLTIERGGVIEAQHIALQGNSEIIEIPITAEHIPNIFVSVTIVKGVDETNPTPAMRLGYRQLTVDTAAKELTIDVTPSASTVEPGDTVTYTLQVSDADGAAVANTDVSVAIVDKAVLSLAQGDSRTLLDVFYYERPLGVTTSASLNINRDRLSQQLSEGAKGGGGGGGGPGMIEVRQDFPDIAFWRANLTTDETGTITFAVPLPDNLTTWTLAAKAITADTLVGETTNDVVATKQLQIRPLLPRFFTAGDRASISAVIRNTADAAIEEGRLTFAIEGSEIVFDTNQESFSIAAGGDTRIDLPVAVSSTVTEVVVTFAATVVDGPELTDAVRLAIPIVRYETPEVVGTSGTVPAEGHIEAIRLPENATESGELAITLEPSLAAGMLDGLNYLEHYEYECNEQTVSRFLPNLLTIRALTNLGIENRSLEQQLNYQLGIGVQRLVNRQNDDGGWGYWPGEESNAFITSYVLWGLVSATEMDYSMPQHVLDNAADYLDRHFIASQDVTDAWQLNQMAFMNFVLSEMGKGDPGRAVTLYDGRERLDYYGQALLAMTLANLDEDGGLSPRIQALLDSLYGAAQLSATGAAWHEDNTDWWTLNTDTRTTSMVLAAFVRLDPDEPLLPMVVRWLMSAREAGHWATTQENAWAIIALTDWMVASRELEGNYDWQILLNGTEAASGEVRPANIDTQVGLRIAVADLLRDEANALQIQRTNESGRLYYTTQLRYYLDALAIDARDRGIVVDRRFELDGKAVESAAVGDVISVTVTVVAPRDLYQALIEVPFPAGTEPLDPRLATTSAEYDQYGQLVPVDAGRPWWWWTPTNIDLRDDKLALMATYLPAGTYEYTFQVQATVPGEYRVLPVHGEMMYFPEVWGRSAGSLFVVRE